MYVTGYLINPRSDLFETENKSLLIELTGMRPRMVCIALAWCHADQPTKRIMFFERENVFKRNVATSPDTRDWRVLLNVGLYSILIAVFDPTDGPMEPSDLP
jgi:hypothetical protein